MNTTRFLSLAVLALILACQSKGDEPLPKVGPIPQQIRQYYKLHPFFLKYTHVQGFPIVSSGKPSDYALLEAAYQIREMTRNRPEILRVIGTNRNYVIVFTKGESAGNAGIDMGKPSARSPDPSKRATWGGATTAVTEGGLLKLPGDAFPWTSMLMHEFAHTVHLVAMKTLDPGFEDRLTRLYEECKAAGHWKGLYRMENREEFWAVAVEIWFRFRDKSEYKIYVPELDRLIAETYGKPTWRYQLPRDRAEPGHLKGFDRSVWDKHDAQPQPPLRD